jgi:hypothetical protein
MPFKSQNNYWASAPWISSFKTAVHTQNCLANSPICLEGSIYQQLHEVWHCYTQGILAEAYLSDEWYNVRNMSARFRFKLS